MQSSDLSSLARSKLLASFTKENSSLHRWVLLKNSLIRASPLAGSAGPSSDRSDTQNVYAPDERDVEDEFEFEEADSFMFPDAEKLGGSSKECYSNVSEAAWLDSLLESLGDDDDEEFNMDSEVNVSTLPVDDDDESLSPLISPLISPISSSDDLVNQAYYPSPIAVSFPVPYPPYHPPLMQSREHVSMYPLQQASNSSLSLPPTPPSSPPPYDDPLPYHDMDDIEDLSVPDATEDTSDDESDALTTPHSSSMLSFIDPASIPLPAERRRRRQRLQVYIEPEDRFFHPFELDPLPFSDQFALCQEC